MSQEETTTKTHEKTLPDGTGNGNGGAARSHKAPKQATPAQTSTGGSDSEKKRSPLKRVVFAVVVLLLLIVGGFWGIRSWAFSQTHVSTDDAFVTGDLVNVSPTISGRLAEVLVEEGDQVKKGQLIARLTDSTQQAAIRESQAALHAAESQIPQAASGLTFQEQSTSAAIQHAQSAAAAQQAHTDGAQREVTLTSATVHNQVEQARSQMAAAQAQAEQFDAQEASARTAVVNARLGIETADRASRSMSARIDSARAEADRAAKDEERYRSLVDQQVISQQQFDSIHAQAVAAQSRLRSAIEDAAQSNAQVSQAKEAVTQAEAQLIAAQKAAAASRKQVSVAQAGVLLAKSRSGQVGVDQSAVQASRQLVGQAEADIAAATAGREQTNQRRLQVETAKAQAAQAAANLQTAMIAETHTYIYAPSDGTIVKKESNPGSALVPGQTVVTMTEGRHVWITANFKETQLNKVRSGQPVEIEIDSFPGKIFRGRVQSINETTGAATSLLPPDNATGNFTKVVQRVPVRIEVVPANPRDPTHYARAEDIRALRQGMSATATIDTSHSLRAGR